MVKKNRCAISKPFIVVLSQSSHNLLPELYWQEPASHGCQVVTAVAVANHPKLGRDWPELSCTTQWKRGFDDNLVSEKSLHIHMVESNLNVTLLWRFWETEQSFSEWRRFSRTLWTSTSTWTCLCLKPTSEVRTYNVMREVLVCSDFWITCVCLYAVVGGLLSAHLLAGRAGMELEPGWPCSGPLLRMAEDAARKLLPGMKMSTSRGRCFCSALVSI